MANLHFLWPGVWRWGKRAVYGIRFFLGKDGAAPQSTRLPPGNLRTVSDTVGCLGFPGDNGTFFYTDGGDHKGLGYVVSRTGMKTGFQRNVEIFRIF